MFWILCLHLYKSYMVAIYDTKIMHDVTCVTLVCIQGRSLRGFSFGQESGLVNNFDIGIYPDITNVINVKFRMMGLLMELYLLIPLSVTLTLFQGHSNVEQL